MQDVDRVPFLLEPDLDERGDLPIVFDDEDAHESGSYQLPAKLREPWLELVAGELVAGSWKLLFPPLVHADRRGDLVLPLVVVAHVHLRAGRDRAFLLSSTSSA